MTPDHLRDCLDVLGWSQQELARQTGVDERQVRRWFAGATIPPPIARWIERLMRFHAANPAPPKVDRRRAAE